VQASTRGTECSGGSFNLYDRRHAWDGYHIVEWTAAQPWSNGKVGEFGSSFPGQTGYWVAATQPPHLAAVSANLLHSDIYRDIFMPGGVQNYLFPTLWTYAAGPHRAPQSSGPNGTMQNDEICTQLQASRYFVGDAPQPQNEPLWAAARSVDDDWYVDHAAITFAPSIKIPYYQQTDWQDEQVGPRAVVLFNHIHPTPRLITDSRGERRWVVPKKFVTSNGDHGFGNFAGNDRWAFFDIFLLGMPDVKGLLDHNITNYFETDNGGTHYAATKSGNSWPFRDTTWTKSYLHQGGAMDFAAPAGAEASDTYLSGAARQNFFDYAPDNFASDVTTARNLPDQLSYATKPVTENFTIAGPIMMNLWASMAGTDADFYVSVSDLFPDGRVSFLQRGLLKASHRAVDPLRSYYAADGETMVQPYMPHTNPQPVVPGEALEYKVEIFPLGYIFRPGHRILIQIHTPPALEKIWGYTPTHHQPAAVTVLHDAAHPTWIQWPVVETDEPIVGDTTPCPLPGGFYCAPPSALNR
jgi:putative CocE/NonD family hydrolase